MDTEKQKYLHRNYPKLYPKNNYGGQLDFECQDGWFSIIDNLSQKLENLINENNSEEEDFFSYAIQVKEKYGSLRFYMSYATEEMFKLIDIAEKESKNTCEVCGKFGKLNDGPWYQTLCSEHTK